METTLRNQIDRHLMINNLPFQIITEVWPHKIMTTLTHVIKFFFNWWKSCYMQKLTIFFDRHTLSSAHEICFGYTTMFVRKLLGACEAQRRYRNETINSHANTLLDTLRTGHI